MAINLDSKLTDEPFPYEIYVSQNADTEVVLAWRLTSDVLVGPRATIWVIGTGGRGKANFVSDEVQISSTQLIGQMLAMHGYGLITGGWAGVDEAVTQSFSAAFERNNKDIRDYLTVVASKAILSDKPWLEPISQVVVSASENDKFMKLLELSDAVIVIGGSKSALTLATDYLSQGKPVFPIVHSGGVTMDIFKYLMAREKDLSKLYEGFALENLNGSLHIAIESVFHYLNKVFPQ